MPKQPNPKYRSADDLNERDRQHYQVSASIAGWFDKARFVDRYRGMFPDRNQGSIIPSDYCFNRENKGNQGYPRFLEWDGDKKYRFVGMGDGAMPPSPRPESSSVQTRRSPSARGAPPTAPVVGPDTIWLRTQARLNRALPDWRGRIVGWGQLAAIEARSKGTQSTDDEVFRAIVLSVLSNNTNWERVERVRQQLEEVFSGYSLAKYAALRTSEVDTRIVPWFEERRAGSMTLRQRLRDLVSAAKKLIARAATHASVDDYLGHLLAQNDRDPKRLALALSSGPTKLDGLGPALAAEALKNIGYDVAKPDRHVNRAAAMFGWVQFRKWGSGDRTRFAAPVATPSETLAVMTAMENCANSIGDRVALLDNAVWLLCATSGLHLTNQELQTDIASG